jgi:hypothetical protein
MYFDPHDPEDLTEKMLAVLLHPEKKTAMARRGREFAANRRNDRPYDNLVATLVKLASGATPQSRGTP